METAMHNMGDRYVIERWVCRYNKLNPYPCKIKGCWNKKGNGRCALNECRLEVNFAGMMTGVCLDYFQK